MIKKKTAVRFEFFFQAVRPFVRLKEKCNEAVIICKRKLMFFREKYVKIKI